MILKIKQMDLISILFSRNIFPLVLQCIFDYCKLYKLLGFHFLTITIPSLEAVTMAHFRFVWNAATSVMMSWCPTGRDSGPLQGASLTWSHLLLVLSFLFGGEKSRRKPELKSAAHADFYSVPYQCLLQSPRLGVLKGENHLFNPLLQGECETDIHECDQCGGWEVCPRLGTLLRHPQLFPVTPFVTSPLFILWVFVTLFPRGTL